MSSSSRMARATLLLLLTLSACASASEIDEIGAWLEGTWHEKGAKCPTTLVFSKPNIIQILSADTEARGTYTISRAVGIGEKSACRKVQCYEMGFEINYSEKRGECGAHFEQGTHDAFLNNFRRQDDNHQIWFEDITFERLK